MFTLTVAGVSLQFRISAQISTGSPGQAISGPSTSTISTQAVFRQANS